ncbi:PA14 domain-containing protein [Gracilibacillus sp. D59]|uniref:PA14 domain-containing protein n=1 Tax=Gracilibacillus sp. D59 TaxID=3457434 RepID=UPI003FCD0AC6
MQSKRISTTGKLTFVVLIVFASFSLWFLRYVTADEQTAAVSEMNQLLKEADNIEWQYLDDGSKLESNWTSIEYNDSSWKTGLAPLGYGRDNNGLNTVIEYGDDSGQKHITTYFRKEFQLNNTEEISKLTASLVRDDGAIVYLNGEEVYRTNLPDGEISFDTLASNPVNDERDVHSFEIDPSLLSEGNNVLAVEVHQVNQTSSDIFFSLSLEASSIPTADNQGLLAEYYTNTGDGNFDKADWKATTIESNIDFSNLDPILQDRVGRADDASIDFTGQIMPEYTEDYTFYMIGDNGFRVWIDDQLVIDHWENDWDNEQTSEPVRLEAGKKYDIRIEYFEDYGGSNLYLRWSSDSVDKQIVPESAFYLPSNYSGPMNGKVLENGTEINLDFLTDITNLSAEIHTHFAVKADGEEITVKDVQINEGMLQLILDTPVEPDQPVSVEYDGKGNLTNANEETMNAFGFSPENLSEYVDYSPISIALSFYGDAKTQRSFAWYTNHEHPENAPENVLDSIVEIVPAGENFDSDNVLRFTGETQVLDLKITNAQNGTFASHKVLAKGLEPGTAYQYRLGSEGNWSEIGEFKTEAENEKEYEFLYMTDSQGANSQDYDVWADTLRQGLSAFPDSKFLLMSGDMVDAGALEYQWLDFFAKPQDLLIDLPLMAAVGNHEGPYNDNYYYHFNYPNDSINNPLPPGSVYSYDYGDAHFMVVNTMDMGWDDRQRESFKQQIEWLKREAAQTDKKWKIVAFHKAIYSVGGHAQDGDILELREMLYPVIDELGIDVVMQGHDHSFMRSYQMYNDKPLKDQETNENGAVINPDGTMYIVNNSAGTKYYDIDQNVDKYYAAKYEQPRTPIFSGVTMTENSLTIDSFKSGETSPFDSYTIVRNDPLPEPVENLSAVKNGDGNIILSWDMPEEVHEEDPIRGFRIYEKEGRLKKNWSVYIPVEDDQTSYQYAVDIADDSENYEFVVKAVDERDNSEGVTISTESIQVAAPTEPIVDDGYNRFGWTNVAGFDQPSDYEFTVDNGETWETVTANPQPVGDRNIPESHVQVRVKANDEMERPAGLALVSPEAFTKNSITKTYQVDGSISRNDKLVVNVSVEKQAEYDKDAYVVFQLMKENRPVLINAIPLQQDETELSQYFDVQGDEYKVKVFVFDQFNGDKNLPKLLGEPLELK